jgi:DNA-binding GntR family transcriptional regulator
MSTITTRICEALAQQIINGDLPPGHKLEEKVLADQYGVSRTPIREALRALDARGLVDFIPRRGGVVAEIGLARLTDMLEAECEAEGLCARLSARRMSALEKEHLQELHRQAHTLVGSSDEMPYLALNDEFHDLICEGAHNATLGAFARNLRARLSPFRQAQAGSGPERMARSHGEHEAIVRAILAGADESAYEAMRNHNARLSAGVLRLLRAGTGKARGADLPTADARDARAHAK